MARIPREWTTEPVDRAGDAAYTDLIRAPGDPERSKRVPAGMPGSDTLANWRRQLLTNRPEQWTDKILVHLADGRPRTFNRIGVEMLDKTADVLLKTPFHDALWLLVGRGEVEHTMRAPVLFRKVAASPVSARPFLKWAGGKGQLVDRLAQFFPARFEHYVEPFVGGGALFFAMRSRGAFGRATIADSNEDLVCAYKVVRDDASGLIARLSKYEVSEETFYKIRAWVPSTLDPVRRAARLIYLNKTCFNGLYRVNLKGQFNAPWGKYASPRTCDPEGLVAAQRALRGAEVLRGDFEKVVAPFARPGTCVYFDPLYWPASESADFTAYTAGGFGPDDHRRLRDCALRLRAGGAHVVLSNADVEPVRALYANHGFDCYEVEARRSINSKSDGRGLVGELIIVAR